MAPGGHGARKELPYRDAVLAPLPTLPVHRMRFLAKRTHRARNILSINDMIPIFGARDCAARRAQKSKRTAAQGTITLTAVRMQDIRSGFTSSRPPRTVCQGHRAHYTSAGMAAAGLWAPPALAPPWRRVWPS